MTADIVVRDATPADVPTILAFIRGLAEYEKLEDQLDLDADRLTNDLFGDRPACWALIGELGGDAVGFALCFACYSTFLTRQYVHLEDLYVVPEARGQGVGEVLLRQVAAAARARGVSRLQWAVLDWNEPAIRFYERLGAELLNWRICEVSGDRLDALAAG